MRVRNYIFGVFCLIVMTVHGQDVDLLDTILTMKVDPFDHQDKLGQSLNVFLSDFEANGHLGDDSEGYTNESTINRFVKLFDPQATLPNDITKLYEIGDPLSISEYAKKAKGRFYLKYSLIIEKQLIDAVRIDSGRYRGTYNYFRLYDEKAIIGKTYTLGAMYTMELEFNRDGSEVQINSIVLQDNGTYRAFKLGNFGYTSNNLIKAVYNLDKLVQSTSEAERLKIAPPKDSSIYRVGPSLMFGGAYIITNHLNPVVYAENINANIPTTYTQEGWKTNMKFIIPAGKDGNFNFTLGMGFESNSYDMSYRGLSFIYREDCFGDALRDLEGTQYDEKYVDVSSYKEKGTLTYLQPELGLLYHINFGKKVKLSLFGNVGFSYLSSSNFSSETMVSYQGKKLGVGTIAQEELGFYQDYQKLFNGEIGNAISFYKLGYGGSLDFSFGERKLSWLVFSFEMNTGLSPAFDTGYEFCPFLDPNVNDTFLSTFTNTQYYIEYNSMAIGIAYRYQFVKK